MILKSKNKKNPLQYCPGFYRCVHYPKNVNVSVNVKDCFANKTIKSCWEDQALSEKEKGGRAQADCWHNETESRTSFLDLCRLGSHTAPPPIQPPISLPFPASVKSIGLSCQMCGCGVSPNHLADKSVFIIIPARLACRFIFLLRLLISISHLSVTLDECAVAMAKKGRSTDYWFTDEYVQ